MTPTRRIREFASYESQWYGGPEAGIGFVFNVHRPCCLDNGRFNPIRSSSTIPWMETVVAELGSGQSKTSGPDEGRAFDDYAA
jgi:hypothetical protein